MRIILQRLSPPLVLATLLVACGGGGGGPVEPPPPSGGIGPAGGTAASSDGRATLEVPPNALSANTAVTVGIETAVPLDPRAVAQSAYRISPTSVQFATPATLTIRYGPALGPIGVAEEDLRVHQLGTGAWSQVSGGSVDAAANTARVAVAAGELRPALARAARAVYRR